MKNSTVAHVLIGLLCLFTTVNSQCVTFYADYNQQGGSFRLCASGNVPANWNDQASSFVVPAGYSVLLYPDANNAGQPIGPFTQGSYNVPSAFNDQLSSAVISQVKPALNKNCVTFYTDSNQQGNSFQLCSSGDVPSSFNDQVSSFVVPAGYSMQLYQDYGYGGQSLGPYTAGTYNMPSSFNDQLSSIKFSLVQPQPQPPKQSCPTFYERKDLNSDSFQLCASGDVPDQWNNKASSFIVPAGFTVYLYQYAVFKGDSLGPYTQGTYNIPNSFDNRLTSAKIIKAQPQPQPQPADRKCPTFYRDADQQGDSFQLCKSSNVPAEWNDQVSSFYVPRGYNVRLFKDADRKGDCKGLYGQGSYNVPADFNDQLSSVYIRRR